MKSSTLIAASSAAMVLATPLDKREYHTETEVVNVWVTVTATSGDIAVPTVAPTSVAAGSSYPTAPAAKARPVVTSKEPEPVVVYETVKASAPESTPADDNVVWVTVTAGGQQEAPKETYKAQPTPSPSSSPKPDPVVVVAPAASSQQSTYTEEPASQATDMKSMSVIAHNLHRANHSAPSVEWSDRIAGYAANTAASCKFAHDM